MLKVYSDPAIKYFCLNPHYPYKFLGSTKYRLKDITKLCTYVCDQLVDSDPEFATVYFEILFSSKSDLPPRGLDQLRRKLKNSGIIHIYIPGYLMSYYDNAQQSWFKIPNNLLR